MRRRFGETVAATSALLLARITEPTVLEDLGEALLDCADEGVVGAAGGDDEPRRVGWMRPHGWRRGDR